MAGSSLLVILNAQRAAQPARVAELAGQHTAPARTDS
jgi:hypothetical protein